MARSPGGTAARQADPLLSTASSFGDATDENIGHILHHLTDSAHPLLGLPGVGVLESLPLQDCGACVFDALDRQGPSDLQIGWKPHGLPAESLIRNTGGRTKSCVN